LPFNIGFPELMLILVLALIVVGPKRPPEIGRTLVKSLREFRRASNELRSELKLDLDDDDVADPPFAAPAPSSTDRPGPDVSASSDGSNGSSGSSGSGDSSPRPIP